MTSVLLVFVKSRGEILKNLIYISPTNKGFLETVKINFRAGFQNHYYAIDCRNYAFRDGFKTAPKN